MKEKVLLYSGGCDSWLIDKLWKPTKKIYVDIDGRYSKEEIARLPADVKIVDMKFLGNFELPNAHVPFRNLYFLTVGASFGSNICYGATAGDTGGLDNRPEFVDMVQKILDYCSHEGKPHGNSGIVIEKKYMSMNKYQLVQEYLDEGGSLDEFVNGTFSCHSPVHGHECWACKACYRKFLLSTYFGYNFGKDIDDRMLDYLKNTVIPKKNLTSGTYFTDRSGGDGEYAMLAVDRFFKKYGLDWRDFQ